MQSKCLFEIRKTSHLTAQPSRREFEFESCTLVFFASYNARPYTSTGIILDKQLPTQTCRRQAALRASCTAAMKKTWHSPDYVCNVWLSISPPLVRIYAHGISCLLAACCTMHSELCGIGIPPEGSRSRCRSFEECYTGGLMAWNRSLELWTSSLRKSLSTGRVIESVSVIHLLQGAFCPSSYGQRNVTLYIVAFRCLLNEISKYTRNYIKL